jgi:Flp pilus assembly pilin Flp
MFYASHQEGQGLTEYVFLLVFVAIAILLILTLMGGQIGNVYSQIVTCLPDPGNLCQ